MSKRILVQQIIGDEVTLVVSGLSETYYQLKLIKDLAVGEISSSTYRKIQTNSIRIDSGFSVRTAKSNTLLVFFNASREEEPIGHAICLSLVKKLKTNFLINFDRLMPVIFTRRIADRKEYGNEFFRLMTELITKCKLNHSHANVLFIYFVGGKIQPVQMSLNNNHIILDTLDDQPEWLDVFEKNKFITMHNRTVTNFSGNINKQFKIKSTFERKQIGIFEALGLPFIKNIRNKMSPNFLISSKSIIKTQVFLNTEAPTKPNFYIHDVTLIVGNLPPSDNLLLNTGSIMNSDPNCLLIGEFDPADYDYLIKIFKWTPARNTIYVSGNKIRQKTKYGVFSTDISCFFPTRPLKSFGMKITDDDYVGLFSIQDNGNTRLYFNKIDNKFMFVTSSGSISLDRYVARAIYEPEDLSTGYAEIQPRTLDERDLKTIEIKRLQYADFIFCGGILNRIESDRNRMLNITAQANTCQEFRYRSYDFASVTKEDSKISLFVGQDMVFKLTRNNIIKIHDKTRSNDYYEQLTPVV